MTKLAGWHHHTTEVAKKSIFTRPSTHRAAITAKVLRGLAWEGSAVYEEWSDMSHEKLEWSEGEVTQNPHAASSRLLLAPLYQERVEGFLSRMSMKALMSEKTVRIMVAEAKVTRLNFDALPEEVRKAAGAAYRTNASMERYSMTAHWNQKKNDEIRKAHPEAIVPKTVVRFIMTVGNGKIVITSETVPANETAKPVLNLTG